MPGREKSARHKGAITARLPELASALRVLSTLISFFASSCVFSIQPCDNFRCTLPHFTIFVLQRLHERIAHFLDGFC